MRPTRADDAGPRSERAAPRHRARDRRGTPPPRHARARGGPRDTGPRASHCRQTGPSGARHSRQAPAKPHGACHNRRHRLSPTVRVIAIGTGSHWGRLRRIGVGNLPAPILGSLPQCPFPAPLRHSNALFPAPLRHSNTLFPAPLRLFPHRKVAPALGSAPIPLPVRSLDTGAGCGGATDSVLTGMPLLARRNHLAHERPSPGAAHDRPVFTALPRSARATPRGCPAQRLSFSRKTARPPPRPARFAVQNSTRRA